MAAFAQDPTFHGIGFNVQQDGRNQGGTATGAFHVGANALAPLGTAGYLDLVTLQRIHVYAQVLGPQQPRDSRRVSQPAPHRMHSTAQSSSMGKHHH